MHLTSAAPHVSGTEAVDDGAILDGSCQTHKVRLVGAHGFSKTLFIPLIQQFGLETDVAKHLTESYGDRAWAVAALCKMTCKRFPARGERISHLYPFVDGEVRYAVRQEYAQTAVDVLARRTRLAFPNAQAALEDFPKIIDIMADELSWDRRRQDVEWTNSKYPYVAALFNCGTRTLTHGQNHSCRFFAVNGSAPADAIGDSQAGRTR